MTDTPIPTVELSVVTQGDEIHLVYGEDRLTLSPEVAQSLGILLLQKASAIVGRRS